MNGALGMSSATLVLNGTTMNAQRIGTMTGRIHIAIIATVMAAAVAVGIASAATLTTEEAAVVLPAKKTDRLLPAAPADGNGYVTYETQGGDNVTILSKVRVD